MAICCATGSESTRQGLVRRVNQLFHELTQDVFDNEHRYRHHVERPFWQEVGRQVLGARGDHDTGTLVLDLACGTGFVGTSLAPHLKPHDRVVAVDVSEAALHSTAAKWAEFDSAAPRCDLMLADGQSIPLADESVDLIAMNAALHHLPDPQATLREIDRLLKAGGHFALGFEPNKTHFSSSAMVTFNHGLTRLSWYASPGQNLRRVREKLGLATRESAVGQDVLTAAINDRLMTEGLAPAPLSEAELLDLLDPHARGADEGGFDPALLLADALRDYEVRQLVWSDYLGQTVRRAPRLRKVVDAALRRWWPCHGSLFSWLIRKPMAVRRGEGV